MKELTEQNFEQEVRRASLPVLVDFYAPWCGPCKMLAPLLEQVAEEFAGRIVFAKVNVDNAPALAAEFGISGVPTLALFRRGEEVDALIGLPSARRLKSWLEQAAMSPTPAPSVP